MLRGHCHCEIPPPPMPLSRGHGQMVALHGSFREKLSHVDALGAPSQELWRPPRRRNLFSVERTETMRRTPFLFAAVLAAEIKRPAPRAGTHPEDGPTPGVIDGA